MELIKPGTRFDFMGMRKYFYALSAFLLAASIVAIAVFPRPNWGTDFKGGTEVEVALVSDKAVDAGAVRKAVEESGFAAPDVVASKKGANIFLIRVQEVSALSEGAKDKIRKVLCFTDEAAADQENCPVALLPTEVKFSPGGD